MDATVAPEVQGHVANARIPGLARSVTVLKEATHDLALWDEPYASQTPGKD
jgi:hypothetical protein